MKKWTKLRLSFMRSLRINSFRKFYLFKDLEFLIPFLNKECLGSVELPTKIAEQKDTQSMNFSELLANVGKEPALPLMTPDYGKLMKFQIF